MCDFSYSVFVRSIVVIEFTEIRSMLVDLCVPYVLFCVYHYFSIGTLFAACIDEWLPHKFSGCHSF